MRFPSRSGPREGACCWSQTTQTSSFLESNPPITDVGKYVTPVWEDRVIASPGKGWSGHRFIGSSVDRTLEQPSPRGRSPSDSSAFSEGSQIRCGGRRCPRYEGSGLSKSPAFAERSYGSAGLCYRLAVSRIPQPSPLAGEGGPLPALSPAGAGGQPRAPGVRGHFAWRSHRARRTLKAAVLPDRSAPCLLSSSPSFSITPFLFINIMERRL
jgi:hypothetical protein